MAGKAHRKYCSALRHNRYLLLVIKINFENIDLRIPVESNLAPDASATRCSENAHVEAYQSLDFSFDSLLNLSYGLVY